VRGVVGLDGAGVTAPLVLELQGTAPTTAAALPCDYCGEGRGAPVYPLLKNGPSACEACMALPVKQRVDVYCDRLMRIAGKPNSDAP